MTIDDDTPFDPGLQLERTSLAWQRTLLALLVGSLAFGRGLAPTLGSVAFVVAGVGAVLSGAMFAVTRRRYRSSHDRLTSSASGSLPHGGGMLACAAALTLVIGLGALLFVTRVAAG